MDKAPEQVQIHLSNPDAAQSDGPSQVIEEVCFTDVEADEKQQGEDDDEADGPGVAHGVPPYPDRVFLLPWYYRLTVRIFHFFW